jgi:hypothetical protein
VKKTKVVSELENKVKSQQDEINVVKNESAITEAKMVQFDGFLKENMYEFGKFKSLLDQKESNRV